MPFLISEFRFIAGFPKQALETCQEISQPSWLQRHCGVRFSLKLSGSFADDNGRGDTPFLCITPHGRFPSAGASPKVLPAEPSPMPLSASLSLYGSREQVLRIGPWKLRLSF